MNRHAGGLILTFVAAMLWATFFAMAGLTPAEEGVPIGAGLIYLLAIPMSLAASATVLATAAPPVGISRSGQRLRRAGQVLGFLSFILWPALFLFGFFDVLQRTGLDILLGGALLCTFGSTLLLLAHPGRRRRSPAG